MVIDMKRNSRSNNRSCNRKRQWWRKYNHTTISKKYNKRKSKIRNCRYNKKNKRMDKSSTSRKNDF